MTDFAKIDKEMERSDAFWDFVFNIFLIAAYITSIINCIFTGKWILLVIDLFVAPIAVIHGLMVWFGVG